MKILLTNYILGGGTGSETWLRSMADALTAFGHEVHAVTDASMLPDIFDRIIVNHNSCLRTVGHLTGRKIFTSHGVLPDLEQPIHGADVYVSVSEEVQENLRNKGFDSVVIRNGIDIKKFKSITPVNKKLTSVLFSSNYPGVAGLKVKLACQELGIRFEKIGGNFKTPNVVEAINRADLVVGLGRTAYEAMACERNVIVYDYNGGDGFVTPETMLDFRQNNCSGRRFKHDYTVEDIKKLFLLYDPILGVSLRSYIVENNNMATVAERYLAL